MDEVIRLLDLGGSLTPGGPAIGAVYAVDVDEFHFDGAGDQGPGVYACDVGIDPLPFPDGFFARVRADDVLERLPGMVYLPRQAPAVLGGPGAGKYKPSLARHYPIVHAFNEAWRVLRKGGVFEATVAVSDDGLRGNPTNGFQWCLNTFNYLAPGGPSCFEHTVMARYKYLAKWQRISIEHRDQGHVRAVLRAVGK